MVINSGYEKKQTIVNFQEDMISSYHLVRCATVEPWWTSALYRELPKFNRNFLVQRSISGNLFMRLRSVVIILLGTGRGMCSPSDFLKFYGLFLVPPLTPLQNFIETCS